MWASGCPVLPEFDASAWALQEVEHALPDSTRDPHSIQVIRRADGWACAQLMLGSDRASWNRNRHAHPRGTFWQKRLMGPMCGEAMPFSDFVDK